ncbi:Bifunctional inhibitor/plant lipid transfer protein/seed storage helical domain [Dillenia turbinata]|uniref:Bifunctional inhibitor/plant lipid transfer protein/seed storage helical domain n=1 Tax=Dillenia turbinata TaxID=194707 RepID=A0AAN8W3G7_9MAGN
MVRTRIFVLIALVLVGGLLLGGAEAQSSSSCTNVIINMSPCLNYITGNSSKPSSSCCQQLGNVVKSQPQCLCEALNGGGSSLGISINKTQALALPSACNVQTPPSSQCDTASSPSSSPSGTSNSPSGSPGSDSKSTGSSTGGDSSYGTSLKLPFNLLFSLLLVTSLASTFTTI